MGRKLDTLSDPVKDSLKLSNPTLDYYIGSTGYLCSAIEVVVISSTCRA